LAKWFNRHGIVHPDDMSGIILTSYWRRLNGKPIALASQVKYFQDYWKESKAAQEKEKRRLANAEAKMKRLLVGLTRTGKPAQTVLFPALSDRGLRIRYMAPFRDGFLVTAKQDRNFPSDDFSTPPFFLDKAGRIHPIRLPEMKQIDEGVVIDGAAYFHGRAKGQQEVLLRCSNEGRALLRLPAGTGALRLGIGEEGARQRLLAVRPHAAERWDGARWQPVWRGKDTLPASAAPPRLWGNRLYLRDEGHHEDDKRLWWLDLAKGGGLVSFDRHVGLVGSDGPRWETVWSWARAADGTLWLAAGSSVSNQSLLTWNKEMGYRIALLHDRTTYTKMWSSEDSWEDTAPESVAITGIEVPETGGVTIVGPRGLFQIEGGKLLPLLRFQMRSHDPADKWTPTHLLTLPDGSYLIGGHWGGLYRLYKSAQGRWQAVALDEKIGPPVTF
jgi:hypothetical protein